MDKNGKINYNEFVASMLHDDYCLRKDYLDYIFKYFDQDNSGKIGKEELHQQISKMGLELPMRVVNEIMREADTDRDGEISYEEFIKAIGNSP
jgi:calcium-dependent protein kinase